MIRHVARAFALVLLVLVAIKVAASLVGVALAPIAALLGLVLLVLWFLDRDGIT